MSDDSKFREQAYQEYMLKLMRAQEYSDEGYQEDGAQLFTHATLYKILRSFCNIIAEDMDAKSCAILLKSHDHRTMREWENEDGEKLIDELINRHELSEEEEKDSFRALRRGHMHSPLTYPYWMYPKGMAQIVAANKGGPWEPAAENEGPSLGTTVLDSGISKDIMQGNIPKFRDRMSIRSTRGFRKLGAADRVIWKNHGWNGVFRNYFGVPIRIHSGGDVVGILKVENKSHKAIDDWIDLNLRESERPKELIQKILDRWPELGADYSDVEKHPGSLFSLAYLEHDLETCEESGLNSYSLIFAPYPGANASQDKSVYKTLRPAHNKRPPIQVFTADLSIEREVWQMLPDAPNSQTDPLVALYDKVHEFYSGLSSACDGVDYETEKLEGAIQTFASVHLSRDVTCEAELPCKYPDFMFRLDLNCSESDSVPLYLLIIPSPDELEALKDSESFPTTKRDLFVEANRDWRGHPDENEDPPRAIRLGEYLYYPRSEAGQEQPRVTDLLLDRLVARTQAFVESMPIAEFTSDDEYKLSWAALEIGRLIEREISYRANRADDPMPLTAMEFYRIPISDLSFVDNLRKRRQSSADFKNNLDYYLQNLIGEMGMRDSVNYSSRIKEYRSFLLRVGERYHGYRRGNIAVWLYLLALRLEDDGRLKGDGSDDTFDKFVVHLTAFRKRVDKLLDERDTPWFHSCFKNFRKVFAKYLEFPHLADLRFDSPPFTCDKDDRGKIVNRLVLNLWREKLIDVKRAQPTGDALLHGMSKTHVNVFLNKYQRRTELETLVIRNYTDFARSSVSLLFQLLNSISTGPEFNTSYEACYRLRRILSTSQREIEEDPAFELLRLVFEKDWSALVSFVEKTTTGEFKRWLRTHDYEPLEVNSLGIYKRIRTLNNVLRIQQSASALDWTLGRYDLLGCRMNCLFKSQVFALYESIWSRGDPFFAYNETPHEQGDFQASPSDYLKRNSRKRWLCVRTKLSDGVYNALNVAALVDPRAIRLGFWEEGGFNLKRFQCAIGHLFQKFGGKVPPKRYVDFASHRLPLRRHYVEWHEVARKITRRDYRDIKHLNKKTFRVGCFLYEGVFDALIYLFESDVKFLPKAPLSAILSSLADVIDYGIGYTKKVKKAMLSPEDTVTTDSQWPHFDSLYRDTAALLKKVEIRPTLDDRYHEFETLVKDLETEHGVLDEILTSSETDPSLPLFFLEGSGKLGEQMRDRAKKVEAKGSLSAVDRDWLVARLNEIRRGQKSYLLSRGSPCDEEAGLWLREQEEVLWRIENLVLLFDPSDLQKSIKDEFLGWTAHDMFYYLRSLIPVEIQIRTELANTVAEQYHNAVYKGHPPIGTTFARNRIEQMGRNVEEVDWELEIDYEDYITKYFYSKQREDAKAKAAQKKDKDPS